MPTPVDLGPTIEGFLAYLLEVRRLSPRSLIDMRCTFNQAIKSIQKIRPGYELWELTLDDFLRWMEQSRQAGKSVTSISKEISHIRGLIDYTWRLGKAKRNVLDGFKLKDLAVKLATPPTVLTIDQAHALIGACERKTTNQKRERLMILLLYGCGLRTGELCALSTQDVDIERQELFIKDAKGGIQRRIPIPESVWTELMVYFAEFRPKRGPLFKTEHKNRRIREGDVLLAVHKAATKADLGDDVMPKTLRHSYGTHLMDAGVDLMTIASLMGHRSPQESGVYLHALPGRKEAAVARLVQSKSNQKEGEV
jgi:site-specific recombinase XerD